MKPSTVKIKKMPSDFKRRNGAPIATIASGTPSHR